MLDLLSCDPASGLAEGACRAKLDTQSSFGGSSLRSSSLRSEGSLGRESTASLTETIDSIDNGDDEMAVTSKQPTGTCWPSSTCDNLFVILMSSLCQQLAKACHQALAIN